MRRVQEWWDELPAAWQQIFCRHLDLDHVPEAAEPAFLAAVLALARIKIAPGETVADLTALLGLESLRELDLGWFGFSGDEAPLAQLRELESYRGSPAPDWDTVKAWPRLRSFRPEAAIGYGMPKGLDLRFLRQLEVLHLPVRFIEDSGLAMLGDLVNLRHLRVSFYGDSFYPPLSLSFVETLFCLEDFELIAAGPIEDLKALDSLKRLRRLSLGNRSSHRQVLFASGSVWPELRRLRGLRHLDLSCSTLGHLAIELESLACLRALETLWLADTEATAITGLRPLRKLPSLKHLSLCGTSVGSLGEIWGLPLQSLGYSAWIGADERKAWEKAHPHCQCYG